MKRFFVALWGASIGGMLFALTLNAVYGRYMIGYDYDSMVMYGMGFGLMITAGLALSAALKEGAGNWRLILTGALTGGLVYAGNVYFGLNAGFSWVGLALISLDGAFCAAMAALLLWSFYAPLPGKGD